MGHHHRSKRGKKKRQREILIAGLLCMVLAVVAVGVALDIHSRPNTGDSGLASVISESHPGKVPENIPVKIPESAPGPTEEELRFQAVLDTLGDRCTGSAPQIKDPAVWNEGGKALMDRLEADPVYQAYGLTASAQQPEKYPYLIAVNRAASTVTVYTPDEEGRYTVPYMAMVCSGGENTPMGFYNTPIRYNWRLLAGPCYGQYATRIWSSYLFHSVPYYTQYQDDLEYDQFNQLGTLASLGCIRLMVVDVKWIYDNCPIGTLVILYDDAEDPGPMGKPGTIYTDPEDEALRGWDPTDPDERNPWDDKYLPGTAIRSDAAWEEYNAAMEDGRWSGSVNHGALRGFSTDSKKEGTRG